ncbi:MAG: hypothetical protein N2749_00515 [Clostridia bacterium]|nr:hypothetical protein [Clostridia bacterium]
MPDFNKPSTYQKEANFSKVKWGSKSLLLNTELNEMQDILTEKQRDFIRNYVGDKILNKGTYSYSNGVFSVSNEVAFVDGEVINITSLQINASDGDKIYLKVWEEEINYLSTIKKYGNEQESQTVTNKLFDEEAGRETARRMQVKYDLTKDNSNNFYKYLLLGEISNGNFIKNESVIFYDSKFIMDYFESLKDTFAMKDGSLQIGLNAEKVGGKRVDELASISHTHNINEITNLSNELNKNLLYHDSIKDTTQYPTFDGNGNITKIEHKDLQGNVIRTDEIEIINIKNLLPNGSYENTGATLLANSGYSSIIKKFGNYSLYITCPNGSSENTIQTSDKITTYANHKYYLSCWVYPAASANIQMYARIAEPSISRNPSNINQWNFVSGILTFATTSTDYARLDNNSQDTTVYYDGFTIIDLTDIFGAGNEPTKEEMDSIINGYNGYIDGEAQLIIEERTLNTGEKLTLKYYFDANGNYLRTEVI